jgi:hypothetical protein
MYVRRERESVMGERNRWIYMEGGSSGLRSFIVQFHMAQVKEEHFRALKFFTSLPPQFTCEYFTFTLLYFAFHYIHYYLTRSLLSLLRFASYA